MQNKPKHLPMSKTNSDLKLMNHYFKQGSQVEITSFDKAFLGSWYIGTVLHLNKKSFTAVVEYNSRNDKNTKRLPLTEKVEMIRLRPLQPTEKRRNFAVNEYVDAFYHDGWWEGIVTEFYGEKKHVVFFKHTRELRAIKASKLRIHREWVYGKWYPDLDEVPVESPEVEVPVVFKKRGVVDAVPLKSLTIEMTPVYEKRIIKSREVEVPSIRERKIQSREVEVPSRKRKTESREVEVPAFRKSKIPSKEVEVSAFKKHKIQSRKIEVSAFKKLKINSRDDLCLPAKEVQLIADMQIVPISAGFPKSPIYAPNKEQATRAFKPGQLVELSNEDGGFEGAWFPVTVIQPLNANKYLIKYRHILSDDEKSLLIEKVDGQIMRPCPPVVPRFDRFGILEDVDAFYNDCWWAGAISKVLKDDEYIVYFGTSEEHMKFRHSQLRVHQKWINGQWVITHRALEL